MKNIKMTQVDYWDSWAIAREKINQILDIAENSIPSIWENWHWYLWWNDTWINATWPQWEQGIQGEQWEKWNKWDKWDKGDKWDKWDKWDQWIQWPKWEQGIQWIQWPQWEKGDQWDKWEKGDQWPQGETWPQWPEWPTWPEWPEWPQWPAWTYTAWQWIDITNDVIKTTFNYWTSDTAAATVQKEVSIPSITELNVWQVIIVKPTVTSTVANSTLKLNDFDAYAMLYNGTSITTSTDSIVRTANVPSLFYLDEVSWTRYWRFLGHWLDNNSTYTLYNLIDSWRYQSGVGSYAIDRYSICMMKPDWRREKITNPSVKYSTWTSKTVNTNWFILNQIKFYNTTTNIANGAFVGANTFYSQINTVNASYSFNCWTAPWRTIWQPIYIVGTIWADWLFYLDTTQWRATQLPSTNDWKLYIRIWTALTDENATISFLANRPIFYHDWTKICDYINEASEIIYKRPTTWNYTLQSSDWVLSRVAI